jgi:endonuclease IV
MPTMPPTLPDGRRLGAHLPLATGMVRAVERARKIRARAMQIWTDNPTAWRRRALPPSEAPAYRARLRALDIGPVAVHASYLINLAGPEPDFFERSIGLLAAELRDGPIYAARFVNVHIGSHRGIGVQAGIERLADGVARTLAQVDAARAGDGVQLDAEAIEGNGVRGDEVHAEAVGGDAVHGGPIHGDGTGPADSPAARARADTALRDASPTPMLVLENSSGSGFGLGTDLDELAGIARAIDDRGVGADRVGFCLDAAHAWGAGIDVSDPNAIDAFLAGFDERIGLQRLVMVHLNDSRSAFGSRLDRHEHIGAGRIGAVGLAHLLTHPALAHVTYYLETPGMDEGYDEVNIKRAYAIAAGQPLRRLPAAAFTTRSASKARTAPS